MQKLTGRRILAGILAPLAGFMIGISQPVSVLADNSNSTSSSSETVSAIYEISMSDQNPLYTLKKEMIQEYIEKNPKLSLDDVDMNASNIQVSKFDRSKAGLQTLQASLNIVTKTIDGTISSYSYIDNVTVKLVQSNGPQIVLKASEWVIDLGSAFNYADNIGIASTSSGTLPAITETDNVDVNTEGTYTVYLTAVDQSGAKTKVSYDVTVRKTEEDQIEDAVEETTPFTDGEYDDLAFRQQYNDELMNTAAEGNFSYYFEVDPSAMQCVDLVKYLFYKQYGLTPPSANGNAFVLMAAAMYPSEFIISSTPQDGVFFSCMTGDSYGHTGYINRIDGDTIYVTECNVITSTGTKVRINYAMSYSEFMARGVYDFLIPVSR
jgi:hypothetical protein